jgi:hypothetical protein
MKLLSPLAYYHTIYLIVKLFRINLCSYGLKIVLFLLDLSLTPFQLLHEFQTSLLVTKYYNKIDVVLNTSNSGVYYYPRPSRDFSPLITQ